MSTYPPLTVFIPAHNAEATIGQAIASTLNQTYPDFELWVLENGSQDRTAAVARSFTDPRMKVLELGPVGVTGALQYALENARSEWLARMDSDDLMFPGRLAAQMEFVEKNPRISFVGTAPAFLTPFGHIVEPILKAGTREVTNNLLALHERVFSDPSIVFNRRMALEAGGVDTEFPKVDGVPLMFRLLSKGRAWEIAEHLHLYRIRPNSLSRENEHAEQAWRVRLKYAPEHAGIYRKTAAGLSGGWYTVAVMELLVGEARSVREAAAFLRSQNPGTARRFRWLSYAGGLGRLLYKQRNPQRRSYRRRRDWEQLFASLLNPAAPADDLSKLTFSLDPPGA